MNGSKDAVEFEDFDRSKRSGQTSWTSLQVDAAGLLIVNIRLLLARIRLGSVQSHCQLSGSSYHVATLNCGSCSVDLPVQSASAFRAALLNSKWRCAMLTRETDVRFEVRCPCRSRLGGEGMYRNADDPPLLHPRMHAGSRWHVSPTVCLE